MPTHTLKTPQQWYQCLEAGSAAVRRPQEVRRFERIIGVPRLTLYHLPSFVDCTGWTLYHLPRENRYLLQRVVWRQQEDSKRIEDLMLGRVFTASAEPPLEGTTTPLGTNASWQPCQPSGFPCSPSGPSVWMERTTASTFPASLSWSGGARGQASGRS